MTGKEGRGGLRVEAEKAACKAAEEVEAAAETEWREAEEACKAERAVACQELIKNACWRLWKGMEAAARQLIHGCWRCQSCRD